VILKSDSAASNWQPVSFDAEFANQIKLFNSVMVDGVRYVVPQGEDMKEIGAVVGWGDTLEEAIEHAKAAGESVKGYGIKFNMGPVDNAIEQIEELEELGISPFEMDKKKKTKKESEK
jgi:hypothetical protein